MDTSNFTPVERFFFGEAGILDHPDFAKRQALSDATGMSDGWTWQGFISAHLEFEADRSTLHLDPEYPTVESWKWNDPNCFVRRLSRAWLSQTPDLPFSWADNQPVATRADLAWGIWWRARYGPVRTASGYPSDARTLFKVVVAPDRVTEWWHGQFWERELPKGVWSHWTEVGAWTDAGRFLGVPPSYNEVAAGVRDDLAAVRKKRVELASAPRTGRLAAPKAPPPKPVVMVRASAQAKPKRSAAVPLAIGAGVVGLGAAGWFAWQKGFLW